MEEPSDNRGVDYAGQLLFHFRRYYLLQDEGYNVWREEIVRRTIPAAQTAIIVCDMWDKHWSRGAAERVDAMAPHMNEVLSVARRKGVRIIHAPSNTMSYYAETPARRLMRAASYISPPAEVEREEPPLPIDDTDSSDTGETEEEHVWTRQHPALEVDHAVDGISDSGQEIYNYLQEQEVRQVLIMGVHTNMCILNRSFGIKQMVKWGVNIALVRDLTDAMYNPASSPYVSHEEGTQLVIGYIEKFWCPSVSSSDIIGESA